MIDYVVDHSSKTASVTIGQIASWLSERTGRQHSAEQVVSCVRRAIHADGMQATMADILITIEEDES